MKAQSSYEWLKDILADMHKASRRKSDRLFFFFKFIHRAPLQYLADIPGKSTNFTLQDQFIYPPTYNQKTLNSFTESLLKNKTYHNGNFSVFFLYCLYIFLFHLFVFPFVTGFRCSIFFTPFPDYSNK